MTDDEKALLFEIGFFCGVLAAVLTYLAISGAFVAADLVFEQMMKEPAK